MFFKKKLNQKEGELINGIEFVQSQINQNNSMIDSLKRVNADFLKRKKILEDQLEEIRQQQKDQFNPIK